MIKASDLITAFQGYLAAGDGYIPDTSGETWTREKQDKLAATNETVRKYGSQWIGHRVEDCSGAFARAYKAHGPSIYHGSNRIAREYVVELLPPSAAKPGGISCSCGRTPNAKPPRTASPTWQDGPWTPSFWPPMVRAASIPPFPRTAR